MPASTISDRLIGRSPFRYVNTYGSPIYMSFIYSTYVPSTPTE
nr:MAG TPA: hypothetical protein [Caudoviricetes sp.]